MRFFLVLTALLAPLLWVASPAAADKSIRAVRWSGAINPVAGQFISEQIAAANRENVAFLLELDTPGGLDTSMRQIIQAQLGSRVPVIVYVSPSGARAASAGALITLAADFAAMAPGTNIGAAHPVSIGPGVVNKKDDKGGEDVMTTKVVNDAVAYARSIAEQRGRDLDWAEQIVRKSISTPASEAVKRGVVDLMAESTPELIQALAGRSYQRSGEERIFAPGDAGIDYRQMDWRQEILNTLGNPNIAYMLLMLGILGIFFEISQPGVIFPGAIGAIALLLAFFGLQTLPVNYVGVLLILVGVVLFILEVKVASYGMLTVGGILALTLGSLMLIGGDDPALQISRVVIAASVAVFSSFFLLAMFFVMRTQKRVSVAGREGMVGDIGEALTPFPGEGRVFVHGEYWDAVGDDEISAGEKIVVQGMLPHMRLRIGRADENRDPEITERGPE
ncbi:NfeD family protein [Geothermobacter hydrogeniphilus]|uniref:Serine protease n=1 Tax=Geothermobacter hydrogeniphilus TaxID=1969733 RepID=A0A1X0Y3C9_9BACT|nr:nodulation protein NfeD [Geothermobacter hydrogeniphilus]ORJ59574.1 serine protease [Geothermobacter hydrogeniphilus]